MPTTVRQLFEKFNEIKFQHVQWEETPLKNGQIENRQGVYFVATSNKSEEPDFDDEQINCWINKLPDFMVDNNRATLETVKDRLTEFWLSDESILYIGKAPQRANGDGISQRVIEYYRTKIGSRSPHSGGQWIKTLKNLNKFTVYYGVCDNPSEIEKKMLIVSDKTC